MVFLFQKLALFWNFGGDNVNYELLSKQEFQEVKQHDFWKKPQGNDKLILKRTTSSYEV